MRIRTFLHTVAALLLFFALPSAPAAASVVYTYTGNAFTDVASPYTTSNYATISFELSDPLGTDLDEADISPLHFTFSDGQQTISDTTGGSFYGLVWTDANGIMTQWSIESLLAEAPRYYSIGTSNVVGRRGRVDDRGNQRYDDGATQEFVYGENQNNPGMWSTNAAIPEPTTLALSAVALTGIALVRRRRRIGR